MNQRGSGNSAKKALNIFKWIYAIEGIFAGILGVLLLANQNNEELVKTSNSLANNYNFELPDGMSLAVFLEITFIFAVISLYALYVVRKEA